MELKLQVVDDLPLGEAIERLGAEWKARTGSEITIKPVSEDEVLKAGASLRDADAIIYPSRLLGTFVERGLIAPLPAQFVDDKTLAWRDTFELLQIAETCWARQPQAVPLGSPVLTLYVREDLLQATNRAIPSDWHEYHELADFLGRRENLHDKAPPADSPWHGSLQPLAEGWAGRVLLARAAPYVKHPDNYSALFDIETMEPLIDSEGFVRALEELVKDYRLGTPAQLEMAPDDVRAAFLAGQAALALTWPAHADEGAAAKRVSASFAELPGARVVYSVADKTWEKRQDGESIHVPLLALSGRLGSVTASSTQPREAFQLLAWLGGREWGERVASASQATTIYRRSQISKPQIWVDAGTDAAAAAAYVAAVQAAFSRQQYLTAPRIPGEAEYMAALDQSVRRVLKQEKSASEALAEAAVAWREITNRLGLEKQKAAYRASLEFE